MGVTTYPLSDGSRRATRTTAVLCMLTVIGMPIAIWLLVRLKSAKLTIGPDSVVVRNWATTTIPLAEVVRIGVLRVKIIAVGIGGRIARQRCGGDSAIHLCFKLQSGAERKFMVSPFENHERIAQAIAARVGRPLEPVAGVGALGGLKWPAAA